MTEVYKHPFQILTTYLSFYEVWVDPDDPEAVLWGLYGDLITGEYKEIRVEMDFDTLNTLISGVDDYQDSAVSFLCDGIITPPDGNGIIDLSESGGLVFWDHIFSLVLIAEVDELGEIVETEEMAYRLIAYVPRKDVVPQYVEYIPGNKWERSRYYNALMAMQYYMYTCLSKTMKQSDALLYSKLNDPAYFAMAKGQYELLEMGKGR